MNWAEADKELQWAILIKMASGKPIRKRALVDVLEKVWKLKEPTTFSKVVKDVLSSAVDEQRRSSDDPRGGSMIVGRRRNFSPKVGPIITGEDFDNTKINIWFMLMGYHTN